MLRIFGSRADSPVWIMLVVVFLGFHTFLFTRVSERLDKALKRVDKLELLLMNIIANNDQHTKEMALSELRHLRSGLDRELSQTVSKTLLRSRRSDSNSRNTDDKNHGKRIERVEKKVKKCLERIRNITKRKRSRRAPQNDDVKQPSHPGSSTPCCRKPSRTTTAVFTVWGSKQCFGYSKLVLKGQVVMVEGSNFLCLPDKRPDVHFYWKVRRNLDSHVNIRGVTYGDIENVDNLANAPNPPLGGRNNQTVPCVVCSRENKTSSHMLLSWKQARVNGLKLARPEYYGVLMSAKHAKQSICVIQGATVYDGKNTMTAEKMKKTAQIHPAELDCDSVRCSANSDYRDGKRLGCSVVTI